jgi:hypothetical protein
MKLLLFYRLAFVALLAVISPSALFAWGGGGIDKPIRRVWVNTTMPMFQDTTTARKKSSDKPKEIQRPPQDVRNERLKEAQRREIKQVPRSLPKLKPQPVSEGLNIRRPPAKAPKKGMSGFRFNKTGSVS